MSPENPSWTVIKTTTFSGRQLQIPGVVAKMIGLRADLPSPGNGIAFLNAGPGVARVAAMASPWVGATRETMPIAVATPTKRLVFSLPRAVERHLGAEVPRPIGEKEVLVWEVDERDPPKVYVRRSGLRADPGPVLSERSVYPSASGVPRSPRTSASCRARSEGRNQYPEWCQRSPVMRT
jgi:hypothetical protein